MSLRLKRSPHAAVEWLGLAALLGLSAFFVATSWRKWPDALVDSGRVLYVPWRISEGGVFCADVTDIYGPLSHHFNAALFACFGPGLIVLAVANLVITAGICSLLYVLYRRAWGPAAGLAACTLFVSVFAFSQLTGIGNYNYVLPYSNEGTHGMLVLLLLVAALTSWCEKPAVRTAFVTGLLAGLAALLKAEILLTAGAAVLCAVAIRWRSNGCLPIRSLAVMALGAVLPTIAFTVYFATCLPWNQAFAAAGRAWLNGASLRLALRPQLEFLGFDRPWANLWGEAVAALAACVLIAPILVAAWRWDALQRGQRILIGIGLTLGLGAVSWLWVSWMDSGRCLPGLLAVYLATQGARVWRGRQCGTYWQTSIPQAASFSERKSERQALRLLLAVTGAVLLARMMLNARIAQFGFCQAAIAGTLLPAALIGELPEWLGLGKGGRAIVLAGALALIGPGVVRIAGVSQRLLRLKTSSIGEGTDRFLAFPGAVSPIDGYVKATVDALAKLPREQSLLVLPEGRMLNYLLRMKAPPGLLPLDDPDARTLARLSRFPPDYVVFISYPLREYGIATYGSTVSSGKDIVDWVLARYQPCGSRGGNPMEAGQYGVTILRRR